MKSNLDLMSGDDLPRQDRLTMSEQILLRRWTEADAPVLFRWCSDPEVGPRAGWPPHGSVQESLEVIRGVFSQDTVWAVVLRALDEPVGCVGYMQPEASLPSLPGELMVGYWIAHPYWNQGLATQALAQAVGHALRHSAAPSLIGTHFVDNPASGRVMEKCGFRFTGLTLTDEALGGGLSKPMRLLRLPLRRSSGSGTAASPDDLMTHW